MSDPRYGNGIEISGRIAPQYAEILTPDALGFAAQLQRSFGGRRSEGRVQCRPAGIGGRQGETAGGGRIGCSRP